MKTLFLIITSLYVFNGFSQVNDYSDIAPGYTKEKHRKLIYQKMDELMTRVNVELDCKKESITYVVIDRYFYKKTEMSLPKTIVVKACGKNMTYINLTEAGIDLGFWSLNGKWILNSTTDNK